MSLPILISVPHAGLRVPHEIGDTCCLTPREIAEDGDGGASEIYAIESDVAHFVTTDIARAIIDLNRSKEDRRKDGVVKTHTCWDVVVYSRFPSEDLIDTLLAAYYEPYHDRLTQLADRAIRLAVDCHTMAAIGPPRRTRSRYRKALGVLEQCRWHLSAELARRPEGLFRGSIRPTCQRQPPLQRRVHHADPCGRNALDPTRAVARTLSDECRKA